LVKVGASHQHLKRYIHPSAPSNAWHKQNLHKVKRKSFQEFLMSVSWLWSFCSAQIGIMDSWRKDIKMLTVLALVCGRCGGLDLQTQRLQLQALIARDLFL
jgi:hypothetical protein